jgi:hypothetical protein
MTPAVVIAFVLATGFQAAPGSPLNSFLTVPGLASENECHKLALAMGAINHKCYAYEMAVPHADVADAVQDELQDQGVIR